MLEISITTPIIPISARGTNSRDTYYFRQVLKLERVESL